MKRALRKAVKQVASAGRHGDTVLVHMSPEEAEMLDLMWGRATKNPKTGLPEHWSWNNLLQVAADPSGGLLSQIPGSPEAAGEGLRGMFAGDYSWAPYGAGISGGDIAGGGTGGLAENPNARRVGRAVGSYFAGNALGGLTGAGAGAGGETLSGMDLAADAPDAFAGNGAFASGAEVAPGEFDYSGFNGYEPGGLADPSGEFDYGGFSGYESGGVSGLTPGGFDYSGFSGYEPGGASGYLPGESSGTPAELWKRLLRGRGPISSALDISSGLYGLYRGHQMGRQARTLERERAGYSGQMQALMNDPSSITSRPGYQAGIQAVNRRAAAGGYVGSGNQLTALQNYGENFYNQELQRLMTLSGRNTGAIQSGRAGEATLQGMSLATLGSWAARSFFNG